MTISWHSVRCSILGEETVLFEGYLRVDEATHVIQNFYYVNRNRYVDILLRDVGDNGSNNLFINDKFTNGGTNILSVIPFINTTYNNPYKLNLWLYNPATVGSVISFNPTQAFNAGWSDSPLDFLFTFASIAGLPPLPPLFSLRSLFSNNAQVYYKPHSLSTGGGGSGVRNARIKKRKT